MKKNILEDLKKNNVDGIEVITVEIPNGTPLKEGQTREYIHMKVDYMVPTAGEMDGMPGVKFEMIREDIGLVTQVIVTDGNALSALKETLTHVISEQIRRGGMHY